MLFKKFGPALYDQATPEYKTYMTDNGKESLDITKNYTVLKQGRFYQYLTLLFLQFIGVTDVWEFSWWRSDISGCEGMSQQKFKWRGRYQEGQACIWTHGLRAQSDAWVKDSSMPWLSWKCK